MRMLDPHSYYVEEWQKIKNRPNAILMMAFYSIYGFYDDNAEKAYSVLNKVLTHKDAGECFAYHTDTYSYKCFSFGKQFIKEATEALASAGYKVGIIDYNMYRNTKEYKDDEERFWNKYHEDREREREEEQRMKEEEAEKERKKPVQLSFFDEWGI